MKKLVMSSLVFPMLFSCVSAMELPQDGGQSSEGRTLRVFRDLALRVRDNNAGKPQRTAVVDPVAARFKAEFAVPATAPEALEEEEQQVEQPAAEEPVAEEPVAEEPVAEEPVAEEPVAEEPVAEEPVADPA